MFDWRDRFKSEVKSATARAPKAVTLKGDQAVAAILGARFTDRDAGVDSTDPLQLEAGAEVELFPTDSGFGQHDKGQLVKLRKTGVAIAVQAPTGEKVRVHAPRWRFRIQRTKPAKL